MLEHLNLHRGKVNEILHRIYLDDYFKYWFQGGTWNYQEIQDYENENKRFAILDNNKNVIGICGFNSKVPTNIAEDLHTIHFEKNFSKCFIDSLLELLNIIFIKYNHSHVTFHVTIGNPVEKFYDKFCKKCGGRVVGTFTNKVRLRTGEICDNKWYEIPREGFLNSIYFKASE